jgi:D-alanine-D-alanine ligase
MMNSKPKVALLVGGTSPERAVSKMSGKGVLQALKNFSIQLVVIDPAYGLNQPKEEEDFFSEKDYAEISNRNCIDAINSKLLDDVDVVFSAMHGKWAEDGTIQSLLELRGLKVHWFKSTCKCSRNGQGDVESNFQTNRSSDC